MSSSPPEANVEAANHVYSPSNKWPSRGWDYELTGHVGVGGQWVGGHGVGICFRDSGVFLMDMTCLVLRVHVCRKR